MQPAIGTGESAWFLGSAVGECEVRVLVTVADNCLQARLSQTVFDNNRVPDFAAPLSYPATLCASSGPGDDPSASARAGQTRRHSKTSPLVMLKASLAATADCTAHITTSATRPASARRLQAWIQFAYSISARPCRADRGVDERVADAADRRDDFSVNGHSDEADCRVLHRYA
jgi:hypothetical protein